jgi:hypothetical protein
MSCRYYHWLIITGYYHWLLSLAIITCFLVMPSKAPKNVRKAPPRSSEQRTQVALEKHTSISITSISITSISITFINITAYRSRTTAPLPSLHQNPLHLCLHRFICAFMAARRQDVDASDCLDCSQDSSSQQVPHYTCTHSDCTGTLSS